MINDGMHWEFVPRFNYYITDAKQHEKILIFRNSKQKS